MVVVRDIQESQTGIACVTCIAWHHLHGLRSPLAGRNAAQDGRGAQDREKLARKSPWGTEAGRLLEDRMEARIGGGGGRIFLGFVAWETLCDATIAIRSLSLPWWLPIPPVPVVLHSLTQQ